MRRRGRKRVARAARVTPTAPPQLGQHLAMDFMQDSLAAGSKTQLNE